jgi:hypothetical protein
MASFKRKPEVVTPYQIESLKMKAADFIAEKSVKNIFTEEEINSLHNNYKGAFPTIEKFRNAKFFEIMGVNLFKSVTQYDPATNMINCRTATSQLELAIDRSEQREPPTLIIQADLADNDE